MADSLQAQPQIAPVSGLLKTMQLLMCWAAGSESCYACPVCGQDAAERLRMKRLVEPALPLRARVAGCRLLLAEVSGCRLLLAFARTDKSTQRPIEKRESQFLCFSV
jgi:hypothetical protein